MVVKRVHVLLLAESCSLSQVDQGVSCDDNLGKVKSRLLDSLDLHGKACGGTRCDFLARLLDDLDGRGIVRAYLTK